MESSRETLHFFQCPFKQRNSGGKENSNGNFFPVSYFPFLITKNNLKKVLKEQKCKITNPERKTENKIKFKIS